MSAKVIYFPQKRETVLCLFFLESWKSQQQIIKGYTNAFLDYCYIYQNLIARMMIPKNVYFHHHYCHYHTLDWYLLLSCRYFAYFESQSFTYCLSANNSEFGETIFKLHELSLHFVSVLYLLIRFKRARSICSNIKIMERVNINVYWKCKILSFTT